MATEDGNGDEKRRKALLLLLLLLLSGTEGQIDDLVDSLAAAAISPQTLADQAYALLIPAHAHAAYVGRMLAGNTQPFGGLDQAFGQAAADEQRPFLTAFAGDLLSDRYREPDSGAWRVAAIKGRAALYARRLLGTANETWALSLPEGALIWWHLEPEADHCDECPVLADNSPYAVQDLPAYPGDGKTACTTNCRCWLSSDAGNGPNLLEIEV